jgi:zinc/manganese transport system substrate-binding protein
MVTNGLGLEGWLPRLMGATAFKGAVIVASTGIKPLGMAAEAEEGQPKPAKPKRVDDPHAWQDLANGQIYVANIVKGLALADPADAAAFAASGAAYQQQLAALDAKVRAMLAAVPKEKRRVITTHDAFQYFGKAYGVTFLAPAGISTEDEPSARELATLERQIKQQHIKALFLENVTNPQMIAQIAKDTGGIVGPPLFSDALSKPDEPAPTYVKMFEHNTATLVEGMERN